MRLGSIYLLLLVLGLCSSCGKEQVEIHEDFIPFSVNSTSAEYDFDACGVVFSGSISTRVTPTKLGFTISEAPLGIASGLGTNLEFTGDIDNTVFTLLFEDYVFATDLHWASFTIIDGETYYGRINTFSQNYRTDDWIESFDISFDCGGATRELIITNELKCQVEGFAHHVELNGDQGLEIVELGQLNNFETRLGINEDINYAKLSIYRTIDPDNPLWESAIVVPSTQSLETTDLSTSPISVGEATGFEIDGYFYLCGGHTTSIETFTNELWRYDRAKDEWTQRASFPGVARAFMTSFVIDGIAYVGSGGSQTQAFPDFYSYDPLADGWNRIDDIPIAGIAGVAFTMGDQGFVTNLTRRESAEEINRQLLRYDSKLNDWSVLEEVPISFENSRNMAVSLNGHAYILSTFTNFTEVYRFDQEGMWEQLPGFPFRCDDGLAFGIDNSLIVTTGRGLDGIVKYNLNDNNAVRVCTDIQRLRSEAVGYSYINKFVVASGSIYNEYPGIYAGALNSTYEIEIDD